MSRICELSGKKPMSGNNVSHAKNKNKRRFYPNLQVKKFYLPDEDRWVKFKVSTSAIKTITKKGFKAYIKDLENKGIQVKY